MNLAPHDRAFRASTRFFLPGLLLLFACQATPGSAPKEEERASLPDLPSQAFHLAWQQSLEGPTGYGTDLYTPQALSINEQGEVVREGVNILQAHRQSWGKVDSLQTIRRVLANAPYEYEIGSFRTDEPRQYQHLIIWKREAEDKKRELEFIATVGETESDNTDIDAQRAAWMDLCNQHDAAQLVTELYTEDALYYNHKPLVAGREAISQEYQYMNRENYRLHLEPILLQRVNENLAFEIGQCLGSYGGKYILIWQKQESGKWQVLFDSNI